MNYGTAMEDLKVYTKSILDTINTTPPIQVFWPDKKKDPVEGNVPWIRVSMQSTSSEQEAFGGESNSYLRQGLLVLEIFTPLGEGLQTREDIVNIILNGYEGKLTIGGIIFRTAQIVEVGADGDWYKTNAIFNYEYTEFK